jgi:hypothetical protein
MPLFTLRSLASGKEVLNEVFLISLESNEYTTQYNFLPGSTCLYYNGQRVVLGIDYEEHGNSSIIVKFNLYDQDTLSIDYKVGV